MTGSLLLVAALAAPPPLGLEAALQRADQGAAVLVARAEAARERRHVDLVRAPASPVLSLGTTRYAAREIVSVSQDIRWGGEKRFTLLGAEELAEAALLDSGRVLLEARRLVRQAWVALAAAEDAEALGREGTDRADEVVAIVRARFEGGRVPRLDLVRAQAEAGRLRANTQALSEARRAAGAHLAALLGLDPASDRGTDRVRPAPLDDAAVQELVTRARPEEHPAFAAHQRLLAAAEAAREASRRRLLPGLSLTLGVSADDPSLPGTDRQATLSLTLPIGSRGRAAVRVAEAEVGVVEARLEAARRDIAEALQAAHHRTQGTRASFAAYEREAVPAAEEAARLTREAYTAGRGDLLRVIDADRTLLEVRVARLQAWADAKAAESDLIAAAGEVTK
jgi:cobalt-zinc-cadmium efflux system outer membrane protein